jgi:hypothetical protein
MTPLADHHHPHYLSHQLADNGLPEFRMRRMGPDVPEPQPWQRRADLEPADNALLEHEYAYARALWQCTRRSETQRPLVLKAAEHWPAYLRARADLDTAYRALGDTDSDGAWRAARHRHALACDAARTAAYAWDETLDELIAAINAIHHEIDHWQIRDGLTLRALASLFQVDAEGWPLTDERCPSLHAEWHAAQTEVDLVIGGQNVQLRSLNAA